MIGRFPILDISPVTQFGGEFIGAKAIPNEEIPVSATIIREGHDGFEAHVISLIHVGKKLLVLRCERFGQRAIDMRDVSVQLPKGSGSFILK